jgi:hypothetical protein
LPIENFQFAIFNPSPVDDFAGAAKLDLITTSSKAQELSFEI